MPLSADPHLEHVADQLAADEHVRASYPGRRTSPRCRSRWSAAAGPGCGRRAPGPSGPCSMSGARPGVRLTQLAGDLLDHAGRATATPARASRSAPASRHSRSEMSCSIRSAEVSMRRRLDRGAVTSISRVVELVVEDLRPADDAGQRRLQVVRHRRRRRPASSRRWVRSWVTSWMHERPPSSRRRPPGGAAAARPPRGSPAARSPGRCAACPRRHRLAAQGAGVRHARRARWRSRRAGRCRSRRDRRRPALAARPDQCARRPGCSSSRSPEPSITTSPSVITFITASSSSAREVARASDSVTRACRAGPLVGAEGEHQHEHRGDHDVDLHHDRARDQVLDRAERVRFPTASRARPAWRRAACRPTPTSGENR